MEKVNIKKWFLLYGSFIIYSFITVVAKFVATSDFLSMIFLILLFVEILLLGIYAILWQQILRCFSLVTAMSNKGIVLVLGLIWAAVFFNEHITLQNIIGTIIIILGICIVNMDKIEKEGI